MAFYYAHSGLRYLVLLAGLGALLYLGWGLIRRRPFDRGARIASAAFNGLLGLQLLLGITLLFIRPIYPALWGHVIAMVLAVGAAHGLAAAGKRSAEPRGRYVFAFGGVAVALLLIVGGILAIREGIFASAAIPR